MEDPRAERAAEMYRAGATWDAIGEELWTDPKTVGVLLRRAGVELNRSGRAGLTRAEVRARQEGKRERALAMYTAGDAVRDIELTVHVNRAVVERWRCEAGLPSRNRRGDPEPVTLLTPEQIDAPGPGDWSLDGLLVLGARRNREIVAAGYDGRHERSPLPNLPAWRPERVASL